MCQEKEIERKELTGESTETDVSSSPAVTGDQKPN